MYKLLISKSKNNLEKLESVLKEDIKLDDISAKRISTLLPLTVINSEKKSFIEKIEKKFDTLGIDIELKDLDGSNTKGDQEVENADLSLTENLLEKITALDLNQIKKEKNRVQNSKEKKPNINKGGTKLTLAPAKNNDDITISPVFIDNEIPEETLDVENKNSAEEASDTLENPIEEIKKALHQEIAEGNQLTDQEEEKQENRFSLSVSDILNEDTNDSMDSKGMPIGQSKDLGFNPDEEILPIEGPKDELLSNIPQNVKIILLLLVLIIGGYLFKLTNDQSEQLKADRAILKYNQYFSKKFNSDKFREKLFKEAKVFKSSKEDSGVLTMAELVILRDQLVRLNLYLQTEEPLTLSNYDYVRNVLPEPWLRGVEIDFKNVIRSKSINDLPLIGNSGIGKLFINRGNDVYRKIVDNVAIKMLAINNDTIRVKWLLKLNTETPLENGKLLDNSKQAIKFNKLNPGKKPNNLDKAFYVFIEDFIDIPVNNIFTDESNTTKKD